MKDKTLYMIGNAHLDPVWLWRWQEGFQAAKATFRSVLDRMNEFEDFVFTSSSAAMYEWVEQNDPRMFDEIRARIAEGRWQIVGGWWIQPDCNLPNGESYVRQGLYGQRYFHEKFGVMASVGYNVDSFGHNAMLPQILRKSGMDSYVFTRPETHEKGLPSRNFWWESDDGSRVLAFRIPFEYCTWGKDLERYVRRCFGELKSPYDELMCFYGVGNHGGGPTRENLESIIRMDAEPGFPRLVFSTPNQYFADVRARDLSFPVIHDELQHHASGCYSAHSGIKRWNRDAENMLLTTEKWGAIAERTTGQPYPDLSQAWKNVLFNQFHDILAGTSLESAYGDARDMHGEAMAIAGRGLNYAVQSLAWNINIEQDERVTPIVVFNPHAWTATVEVDMDIGRVRPGDTLLDDTGREVPMQLVRPPLIISGWRNRLSFVAELPPLGYRVYRVLAQTPAPTPTVPGSGQVTGAPVAASQSNGSGHDPAVELSDTILENDFFRLEFDPQTGYIARLYDKQHQCEVFIREAAQPLVIEDRSDTWGHGVYQFGDVVGQFVATRIRRVEHGPVKSVIRVESTYGNSRLTQDFAIYQALRQIEVRVTVDWHEQFKLLKLRFPLNLNFLRATYEIPYGTIERPTNGEEEPCLSWVDLSGIARGVEVPYGLSILNDGKYSFDIKGREMSLTVLRSPIYAHHDPTKPRDDEHYSFIDQGVQYFTYTLLPHADSWEQAGTVRRAAELNQRPIALVETYHPGPLPQQASYLSVDNDNIVVAVVKRAEDNDDLIVRCYETNKVATQTTIHLPMWNRSIATSFGPAEIKTFRIPKDAALPIHEVDMLERVIAQEVHNQDVQLAHER
jgi:alpha-mannosidase